MSNETQALQDIKAGDSVIVRSSGYGRTLYKRVVTKITATQIVCDEYRYYRETGKEVGARNNLYAGADQLLLLTDELDKQCQHQENLEYIASINFKTLDDATLQAVVDALKSAKKVEA